LDVGDGEERVADVAELLGEEVVAVAAGDLGGVRLICEEGIWDAGFEGG
jgi:hypothetical protein